MTASADNPISILLVAGGTGGHISPGLALAEALQAAGSRPVMLSLGRNKAYPDFQSPSFPLYFYNAPPIRKSPVALLLFVGRFAIAVLRAWSVIRREKIRAVIGLGGYPMAPALVAALLRNRPIYLCEQNAVPGKVTRILARRARRVFLSIPLESGREPAPADRLRITGNPLRERIVRAIEQGGAGGGSDAGDSGDSESEANIFATLRKRAKRPRALRVLVVGGSQGAMQLNEMTFAARAGLDDAVFVVQCGAAHLDGLRKSWPAREHPDLHLFGFTRDIHALYRTADVLVCRAGAGVLTEAVGFGLPLVLVPYPFAADNHQLANARVFADAGAARLIDRRDTDPGELIEHLRALGGAQERKNMAKAARGLARLKAAGDIAARVMADIETPETAG